ncbi:BTAD domain-containing putative transcriptional regulator [Actinoplanes sp. NPDC049548]|uniref:AfsR/SARP family transcriptional regulator n=1 Tax=Actinoplanes sp. NPDC049548 TaxID=3155152 RepID=UPI00341C97C6
MPPRPTGRRSACGRPYRVRSSRTGRPGVTGSLAELDAALAVAGGHPEVHPAILGLVQHNRSQLLLRTGRLREARDGFRAASVTLQRSGAGSVAYPLTGLGEAYELSGAPLPARASYEEAVEVATTAGNAQALVPALSGLARVLAALGDDAALPVAQQALAGATGLTAAVAEAAAGWAALAAGDRGAAAAHADRTLELARGQRNFTALAEGLELAAMAGGPVGAPQRLSDAAAMWKDVGDPVSQARVVLAKARFEGRPAEVVAEDRLRTLGSDPASGTRSLAGRLHAAPVVRVLGTFTVLLNGRTVPVASWQSRKARDLLKVLVARRGRPATREALGELLWPGEESVANRLSITLSVLRKVLDPDRRAPADTYVVADAAGVRYDPANLRVDVDGFLHLVTAGAAAARAGRAEEARILYEAAVDAYTGEVLDDEPDLAPVVPLRDEARAAFLAAARALGELRAAAGDVDGAVSAWLRLLEADPYDEDCSLRLIALLAGTGRHGEAARHHHRYAGRMRELGAPVVPLARVRTVRGHTDVPAR